LHRFEGNLLFADGHIEEKSSKTLKAGFQPVDFVADLALPSLGTTPNQRPVFANPSSVIATLAPPVSRSPADRSTPASVPAVPVTSPAGVRTINSALTPASGAFLPNDSVAQSFTNANVKSATPSTAKARATKPDINEEPGFSLFPSQLGTTAVSVARKSLWIFYLLLLLFGVAALVLRSLGSSKHPQTPAQREKN
jgi:prepilin-type processing-associated H-X9-DG protein